MLAAGKTEAEVYESPAVPEATWSRWRKQYGGMKPDEAKRRRGREQQNRWLKELLAESDTDIPSHCITCPGLYLFDSGHPMVMAQEHRLAPSAHSIVAHVSIVRSAGQERPRTLETQKTGR